MSVTSLPPSLPPPTGGRSSDEEPSLAPLTHPKPAGGVASRQAQLQLPEWILNPDLVEVRHRVSLTMQLPKLLWGHSGSPSFRLRLALPFWCLPCLQEDISQHSKPLEDFLLPAEVRENLRSMAVTKLFPVQVAPSHPHTLTLAFSHTLTHTRTHVRTHISCTHARTHACTHTRTHAHTHTHVRMHMHTHTCMRAHLMHARTHATHTHTRTHTRTRTHTHICMYTHTRKHFLPSLLFRCTSFPTSSPPPPPPSHPPPSTGPPP